MMAYLIQIAGVVVAAEVVQRVVPVASAGFRYAYWRLVLLGALVMPWLLPRADHRPHSVVSGLVDSGVAGGTRDAAAVAMTRTWDLGSGLWDEAFSGFGISTAAFLYAAAAAGVVARLVWVACGMARLRSLDRRAAPLASPIAEEIQRALGTRAEVRMVAGLAQPVTFGVLRPVVLIPDVLLKLPESVQRAALTHELVHVRRRDWAWVLAEEALRAVFWFHPAVWWATARVRSTREEFTDHFAILATGSRRAYVEALLAFADCSRVEPAPAFARRADLFRRIVLLTKEPAMTSRRIVTSGLIAALSVASASVLIAGAFPVDPLLERRAAATQGAQPTACAWPAACLNEAPRGNAVTPENPIPRRLFAVPVPYPIELQGSGVRAAVEVAVVVDAAGFPIAAHAVAVATTDPADGWIASRAVTPEQRIAVTREMMASFGRAAADAIVQWRYDSPAQPPLRFYVGVAFVPGGPAVASQSAEPRGVSASGGDARVGTRFNFLAGAGRRGGGAAGTPAQAVAGQGRGPARSVELGRSLDVVGAASGEPLRVGGDVLAPRLIRKVAPAYPLIARSARVQGVVILELTVDEQGAVSDVRVLRSIPLLDQAAVEAARQWRYEPTLLNGAPVPLRLTVTVPFNLDDQSAQ